jgi:hypothetical protein
MNPKMVANEIPEQLRGIQRFLREAAQTKAESRPDYAKFKHLAGSLSIY